MDWKQMWNNTVAMLTPDIPMIGATAYILFMVVVPLTGLLYVFTTLAFN